MLRQTYVLDTNNPNFLTLFLFFLHNSYHEKRTFAAQFLVPNYTICSPLLEMTKIYGSFGNNKLA